MAALKSREGNRLTPVLRIELSPLEELRKLHSQIFKTDIKPKCNGKRKEYNQRLQEIERQINISAGGEPYISLENRVDFEKFPEQFKYTCRNIPGAGVKLWPDPEYIVACDCKDRCTEKNCSCPVYSGGEFAYDEYGRVTLARRRPIYECNMKCPCRKSCRNRVVQRGRRVRVSLSLTAGHLDSVSCNKRHGRTGLILFGGAQYLVCPTALRTQYTYTILFEILSGPFLRIFPWGGEGGLLLKWTFL
jgi:hypothetical protein